jgi:hypothetical protein
MPDPEARISRAYVGLTVDRASAASRPSARKLTRPSGEAGSNLPLNPMLQAATRPW